MEHANYPCAQKDLYPSCRLGWRSCTENQPAFLAYKNKYTPTFLEQKIADITVAELIKGLQARTLTSEGYHADLVEIAFQNRENFQTLKRYIADAFPPERLKMQYEAAGQEYYEKASNNNWGAVESLNTYAYLYITEFEAILTAQGYMPAAFVTKFNADRDAFAAKHLEFMNQEETDEEGTRAKIVANNGIYTDLINMCLDGQEIFKNDEVMRKQFTFSEILKRATGAGQAGIRGLIRSLQDGTGIPNVEVTILGSSETTHSDEEGNYLLKPLSSGTYTVRFSAPGYRDLIVHDFHVEVGTVSTLDVQMEAE